MFRARTAALLVWGALTFAVACSSSTAPVQPPPPPCGAICGGIGPVAVTVANSTAAAIHLAWWWRNAQGDSSLVAPGSTACVRFTADTWAQILAYYGTADSGGYILTNAFDPVAFPKWLLTPTPAQEPKNPPFIYGFHVTTNPESVAAVVTC